jgi:archaellum component FlaC
VVDGNQGSFADLLEQVKDLLLQAKAAGELLPPKADEIIKELESAKELVEKEKNPPRETLLQKLRRVADEIDDALESFDKNRSPAAVLLRAIPFVALLIKLASEIF